MREIKKTYLQDRVLYALFMSVTDNDLQKITGEISPSATWKKLEELYSAKSLMNHFYLKQMLYNLRTSKCETIQ